MTTVPENSRRPTLRQSGQRNCVTMSEPYEKIGTAHLRGKPSLSSRLQAIGHLNEISSSRFGRKYTTRIQDIVDALVEAGYTSLDKQAKALGIHRATAWTIVRTKHKLGRLNLKTTERMLANRDLPPSVRIVIEQYLAERFAALPKSLTQALADIE